MLRIVDPTGRGAGTHLALAVRPTSIDKLRIGVFSNGKPNAANLVRAVHRELSERFALGDAVVVDKGELGLYTTGAPRSILDELSECGVVIHGSGD